MTGCPPGQLFFALMITFALSFLPLVFLVFSSRTMPRSSAFALAYLDVSGLLCLTGLDRSLASALSLAVFATAFSRHVRNASDKLSAPLLVALPLSRMWHTPHVAAILAIAALAALFNPAWRKAALLVLPSIVLADLFMRLYHLSWPVGLLIAVIAVVLGHLLQPIRLSKNGDTV